MLPEFDLLGATIRPALPKLPQRQPFQLPKLGAIPKNCAACQKSIKNEAEFCLSIQICRKCINIYGLIDTKLNEAAERKTLELKRQNFLAKLEAK